MKLVGFKVDALHLFIGDGTSGRIFAPVKPTDNLQSFGRGTGSDEMDDGLIYVVAISASLREMFVQIY